MRMKSVVFSKFGAPGEVLTLGELPAPQPGPGQVRVHMRQSVIHNHDLAIIRGIYGYRPTLPAVPGTEAVGVVESVGPEADGALVGQRVSVAGVQGTWAEYFLAPARVVVPVPDGVPDEVACQLLAMPMSAYLLLDDLAVAAGEWIIQNAASGAVGRMIESLGAERGVNVINLVRRAEAAATLRAAGARHVLAVDEAGWAARVPAITGGAPVVRAVDSVSGKAANDLMNVLAPGGTLVSFGALSGEPLVLDVANVLFKQATVKGFWASKRTEQLSAGDSRRIIGDLVRLALQKRLPLSLDASFPLGQAAEAALASEKPGRTGKIGLGPG